MPVVIYLLLLLCVKKSIKFKRAKKLTSAGYIYITINSSTVKFYIYKILNTHKRFFASIRVEMEYKVLRVEPTEKSVSHRCFSNSFII